MRDFKVAVLIGRFQPFHNSHLEIVKKGLKIADKVVLVLGSAKSARSVKNPFTFEERSQMISGSFSPEEFQRIEIVGVRDYYISDTNWTTDVQTKVSQFISPGDSVALLGSFKDSSSYYLRLFPQWEFVPTKTSEPINATDIRNELFGDGNLRIDLLPPKVSEWLAKWSFEADKNGLHAPGTVVFTERLMALHNELQHLEDYKAKHSWKDPRISYEPIFHTVDTVVVSSGHVLLVKRKFSPGKGLWALPGGFVRADERLEDAAIRELKEETGIYLDKAILKNCIVESKTFDHPGRSLRGRTITTAYYVRLRDGELPLVRGNDDAESARWVPLMDVGASEDQFFEDHFHIIQFFLSRG